MSISILVVRALVAELEHRGFAGDAFLSSAGVDPDVLEDAGARLTFAEYDRCAERALELTREPQLGLFVGARDPSTSMSSLAPLIASSRTLTDAARVFLSFASLVVDGIEWTLTTDDGVATFRFVLPEAMQHRAFCSELCMATIFGVMRAFDRGGRATRSVHFTHAPTGPLETYQRLFECAVHFESECNALRGDATMLDQPHLHANVALHATLLSRAESLLDDLRSTDRLPGRIRDYVATRPHPFDVTAVEVATAVGMSPRTLRRRLAELGTSPTALIDEAAREIACASLKQGVPIKTIAFRLGFSEPSSFYRTFRRWTGMTPSAFRSEGAAKREE